MSCRTGFKLVLINAETIHSFIDVGGGILVSQSKAPDTYDNSVD